MNKKILKMTGKNEEKEVKEVKEVKESQYMKKNKKERKIIALDTSNSGVSVIVNYIVMGY